MRRKVMTMTMATFFSIALMGNPVLASEMNTSTSKEALQSSEVSTTKDEEVFTTTEISSDTEQISKTNDYKKPQKSNSKKKTKEKKVKKEKVKKKAGKEKVSQKQSKPKTKTAPGSIKGANIQSKKNKEYIGRYIYFNQADPIWNQNSLNIHSAGCGPTAVAVCISNLTNKWITPIDTTQWAYDNGYYSSDGTVHSGITAMTEHFGLKSEGLGINYTAIKKSLLDGNPVVGLMGPGYFTGGGHFIALLEIDKNDKVTVADVGSRKRTSLKYDLSYIISQSKAASAGGPFWSISKESIVKMYRKKKDKIISLKKKEQKEKKSKNDIIDDFYKELKENNNKFENKIPVESLLYGKKVPDGKIAKGKINECIDSLGVKLNSPYIRYIAKHYSFGEATLSNFGLEMEYINLNDILLMMD